MVQQQKDERFVVICLLAILAVVAITGVAIAACAYYGEFHHVQH